MEGERKRITIKVTNAMFEDTKRLADACRITHSEWVRRCLCLGAANVEFIRNNEPIEPYRLKEPGRPME